MVSNDTLLALPRFVGIEPRAKPYLGLHHAKGDSNPKPHHVFRRMEPHLASKDHNEEAQNHQEDTAVWMGGIYIIQADSRNYRTAVPPINAEKPHPPSRGLGGVMSGSDPCIAVGNMQQLPVATACPPKVHPTSLFFLASKRPAERAIEAGLSGPFRPFIFLRRCLERCVVRRGRPPFSPVSSTFHRRDLKQKGKVMGSGSGWARPLQAFLDLGRVKRIGGE